MNIAFITVAKLKKHLKVTHLLRDDEITDLRTDAIRWAQNHLGKTVYELQVDYDQAILDAKADDDCVDVEVFMLNSDSVNRAIALFVEYHYYGVSAVGAEKIIKAAENLLDPDVFVVAW